MAKSRSLRGQTLVELALVLPCFCLGVFMAVQLICYCHNMIELQRMVQVMADRVSYDNYRARKSYSRFNSMWGRFSDPWVHFSNDPVQPWLPFHGKSTIQEPGRFIRAYSESDLLPGQGFSRVLAKKTERAYAETYLEPPIPPED